MRQLCKLESGQTYNSIGVRIHRVHVQNFQNQNNSNSQYIVADIMQTEIKTVIPDTHITDAIKTMKKHEIGCLPVALDTNLVGIITIKDVIEFDHE